MIAERSDGRGILYPAKLPTIHREPARDELRELVRWFWILRWDIAPGRVSRQELLPFPASNLVVQPDGVSLAGPATGSSYRDLQGRAWVVGALLRPAAVASLQLHPNATRGLELHFHAPQLRDSVSTAMRHPDETKAQNLATAIYSAWIVEHLSQPDGDGLRANAMEDLIASDRTIISVSQVAERMHMSTRGVQRLSLRYVGLPPLTIIRRYRLQEAAYRLREDPNLTVAQVAADLGYADHAHLTTDFRRVLGLTPTSYRRHPGHTT